MATESDDMSDSARALYAELVKLYAGTMERLTRDATERRGEPPTSITELWDYGRPADHNPYRADGRPVAWDFTRNADARDAFDMLAATSPPPSDGMWDLPKHSVAATGEWLAFERGLDFAAVYAAVDPGNDDTGTWESYKACRADGFGGYWMVDAPPIDPLFARLVVEDAMGRIGMNPRRGRAGE